MKESIIMKNYTPFILFLFFATFTQLYTANIPVNFSKEQISASLERYQFPPLKGDCIDGLATARTMENFIQQFSEARDAYVNQEIEDRLNLGLSNTNKAGLTRSLEIKQYKVCAELLKTTNPAKARIYGRMATDMQTEW